MTKKKSDGRSKKAIKLTDKLVIDYARFHSTPYSLRSADCKSADDFLIKRGYSKNSRTILYNITQIDGFWSLRQLYASKFHSYYETVADEGLLKRAEGTTVREEAVVQKTGEVVSLEKELPPDVSACVAIKKIFGKYEETIKLDGLGDVMKQLAGIK